MPRSPLQLIGAMCKSSSPDFLKKLRERCQSKWLLANHSVSFPWLIQGPQFNSTEPVPMLRCSAVLIGCIHKDQPPPASDWLTDFRMCDARGSNEHGSDEDSLGCSMHTPPSRRRRLALYVCGRDEPRALGFSSVTHTHTNSVCLRLTQRD